MMTLDSSRNSGLNAPLGVTNALLASDFAIDALNLKIERHGEGLWRFADEERTRPSVPRQTW